MFERDPTILSYSFGNELFLRLREVHSFSFTFCWHLTVRWAEGSPLPAPPQRGWGGGSFRSIDWLRARSVRSQARERARRSSHRYVRLPFTFTPSGFIGRNCAHKQMHVAKAARVTQRFSGAGYPRPAVSALSYWDFQLNIMGLRSTILSFHLIKLLSKLWMGWQLYMKKRLFEL